MKAVQLIDTNNIEIRDIAIPEPSIDEVLVKVTAVGINPVDWKIATGMLSQLIAQPLPMTLGWDFAGEVVKTGGGYLKGDKVYGMKSIGKDGTLSEYCTVKRDSIALAPSSVSMSEAAALPMVALTSWQALFDAANVRVKQRVLIQAGAGGVGSTAIQLAKAVGAYVITTTSAKNRDYVLSLGADEVIDYQQQDIIEELENNPVDVVFESMWGQFQVDAIQIIKPSGTLISLSGLMPETEQAAKEKGVNAKFVFVQPNAGQLRHISEMVDGNQLRVHIEKSYPFEDVVSAYENNKQVHSSVNRAPMRGKLVATL
ncbi:NADP-dependent oxidoreductase [Thaumasiovibrio subtropicus]|uniref:NADP-dependent oxidoreductase n=1 Tax=Thaumasiovibrio subtropicus TaxID=1891207 RepID=UPI000B364297|nr:NADP-dependent oxidoreductase [Thaumasiovibrio subtropicus]